MFCSIISRSDEASKGRVRSCHWLQDVFSGKVAGIFQLLFPSWTGDDLKPANSPIFNPGLEELNISKSRTDQFKTRPYRVVCSLIPRWGNSGNGGILRHRSLMKPMHRCLFEPRCGPLAAEGGAWIPVRVGELDRGAIDEAVGAGEFHLGGKDK